MDLETNLPLPLDPLPPAEADDRRLWIGNLDSRVTEYHLIKLLQKYGKVTKFDFLFHKSGPQKGQPRGYCFVTYEERHQAQEALAKINGKFVIRKSLIAKWAHTVPTDTSEPSKKPLKSSQIEDVKANKNVCSQINAIEAKLKAMEEQPDKDLEVCLSAMPNSETSIWQQQQNDIINRSRNACRTREFLPYNKLHRRSHTSRYIRRR